MSQVISSHIPQLDDSNSRIVWPRLLFRIASGHAPQLLLVIRFNIKLVLYQSCRNAGPYSSPSASGLTPAIRVSPYCPPAEALFYFRSSSGALPQQACTPVPKAAMIYQLPDTLPAKAVDTPDNSKGVDGNGGGTAGTPLVGVEAISALGSQTCETLHRYQSPGVDIEPSASRVSRTSRTRNRRAALPPSNTGELGNTPS